MKYNIKHYFPKQVILGSPRTQSVRKKSASKDDQIYTCAHVVTNEAISCASIISPVRASSKTKKKLKCEVKLKDHQERYSSF